MTKRSSCLSFLFFIIFSSILLIFAGIIILYFVESRITEDFGEPDLSLTLFDKLSIYPVLLKNGDTLSQEIKQPSYPVIFRIDSEDNAIEILSKLKEMNLINQFETARSYIIYSGIDRLFKPGSYQINKSLSTIETLHLITDSSQTALEITFLPGLRSEEIADILTASGIQIDKEKFFNIIHNQNLEGYLYPGTYILSRDTTERYILSLFTDRFDQSVTLDILKDLKKKDLSVKEGIILGSIIEREAVLDSEKPLIASVFLNRLARDMPLGSDPTVQYAIGYNQDQNTWWKTPVLYEDLNVNSPYNTYINVGLPPTPISNPDLTSILAILEAPQTEYLYFRASCDNNGEHVFSYTYEEHLSKECPTP